MFNNVRALRPFVHITLKICCSEIALPKCQIMADCVYVPWVVSLTVRYMEINAKL